MGLCLAPAQAEDGELNLYLLYASISGDFDHIDKKRFRWENSNEKLRGARGVASSVIMYRVVFTDFLAAQHETAQNRRRRLG